MGRGHTVCNGNAHKGSHSPPPDQNNVLHVDNEMSRLNVTSVAHGIW